MFLIEFCINHPFILKERHFKINSADATLGENIINTPKMQNIHGGI